MGILSNINRNIKQLEQRFQKRTVKDVYKDCWSVVNIEEMQKNKNITLIEIHGEKSTSRRLSKILCRFRKFLGWW